MTSSRSSFCQMDRERFSLASVADADASAAPMGAGVDREPAPPAAAP